MLSPIQQRRSVPFPALWFQGNPNPSQAKPAILPLTAEAIGFRPADDPGNHLGYETLMAEIAEQPACVARLVDAAKACQLDQLRLPNPKQHTQVIALGVGSSANVYDFVRGFFEAVSGLPLVSRALNQVQGGQVKWSHLPFGPSPQQRPFYLASSQSGNTAATIQTINLIRPNDNILYLSNGSNGEFAKRNNHFPVNAGPESSIAATKSFTANAIALMLVALKTAANNGRMTPAQYQTCLKNDVLPIASKIQHVLTDKKLDGDLRQWAKNLKLPSHYVVMSDSFMTQVLPELKLKLTETSGNTVEMMNTETMKHGPLTALGGVRQPVGQIIKPHVIYIIPPDHQGFNAEQFFNDIERHYFNQGRLNFPVLPPIHFIRFQNSPKIPVALQQKLQAKTPVLVLPAAHGMSAQFSILAAWQKLCVDLAAERGQSVNHPALVKAVVS